MIPPPFIPGTITISFDDVALIIQHLVSPEGQLISPTCYQILSFSVNLLCGFTFLPSQLIQFSEPRLYIIHLVDPLAVLGNIQRS